MRVISHGVLDMEPTLVLSDRPDAAALDRARRAGVATEVAPPAGEGQDCGRKLLQCVQSYSPDIIALAGFMPFVPPDFVRDFPGDVINIHSSLLPASWGLHAQQQALDCGVRVSGCTVHFVDGGLDSGPVILQAAVAIYPGDDEGTLSARTLQWEHRLYPRALRLYVQDRLQICGRKVTIVDE